MEQCSQSTPVKDGKFVFNDTMTSLSEKLSWSVIDLANENKNSSSSNNETLSDSPIKQKRKRQYIQLLCAEEHSEEQSPESYDRKLDTVGNGRNNEADETEKIGEIAEEQQDIHLQIDSKKNAAMFYPLKVVEEIIVIESDVNKTKSCNLLILEMYLSLP